MNPVLDQTLAALAAAGHRNGRHKRPRIGMRGLGKQALRLTLFDDAAEIHDRHVVADLTDDPEIVAYEEIGDAEAILQVEQKVHHLRLDRNVERRDRLVPDQQAGFGHERARQHHALAQQVAQHGWLLSELPPGTPPLPHHFPMRNRLIEGLSHGVLVVEAALKSGSLITADMALSQGKDVFAVPGSIHSVLSRGCHALLRQGAKLVENAQDVLEELPVYSSSLLQQPEPVKTAQVTDSKQQALLKAMGHDPQSLEMLLLSSELELEDALLAVQALIDMGRVAQMPGGLYQQLC